MYQKSCSEPAGDTGQTRNNAQHQNTNRQWTAEAHKNTPVRSGVDGHCLGVSKGFPEQSPSKGTHRENRRCDRRLPPDTRDTKTDSSLCASFSGRPGLPLVQETHSLFLVMVPACTALINHPPCPVSVPSNKARTEGTLRATSVPLTRWRRLLGAEDGKTETSHGLQSPQSTRCGHQSGPRPLWLQGPVFL